MGIIQIEDMEFFAFHGHFSAEQVVGNQFMVDVALHTDCHQAASSDKLRDALDYQAVYAAVKEEMARPSHLLEHLCGRILDRFFYSFPDLVSATIKVRKMNPPMGGKIGSVSVTMSKEKSHG